jgi:hypothetical protein
MAKKGHFAQNPCRGILSDMGIFQQSRAGISVTRNEEAAIREEDSFSICTQIDKLILRHSMALAF